MGGRVRQKPSRRNRRKGFFLVAARAAALLLKGIYDAGSLGHVDKFASKAAGEITRHNADVL